MTLLDAPKYDPKRDKRRRLAFIAALIIIFVGAYLAWHYRNWPEEHIVDRFFNAVQAGDYKNAYAIWTNDPQWQEHPQKYKNYSLGQFELDWGPTSEYGQIRKHKIVDAVRSPESTAVIVAVTVNDRARPFGVLVDRKTKQMDFLPPSVELRVNTF